MTSEGSARGPTRVHRGGAVVLALLAFAAGGWAAVRVLDDEPPQAGPPGSEVATTDPGPTGPVGSVPSTSTTSPAATTTESAPVSTTTTQPGSAELAAVVAALTPQEKARQLVMVGFGGQGPTAVAGLSSSLGDTCVGGVFVARNWSPSDSASAATEVLDSVAADAGEGCVAGPLIATDAEPGTRVLKVPVSPLPSAPELHAIYEVDAAAALRTLEEAGAQFASELAAIGVHVNFGVIADVDVDDDYYMARQGRSFGPDPDATAALVAALVDAHCDAGVAATLKHFPNQGATLEDPHGEPSYSVDDAEAFAGRGRIPYVDTSSPLVMTGHIFMDVDPDNPASLSSVITTGMLRGDLDYDGVIVTDDLGGMVGVTGIVPEASRRAVEAISAGADVALFASPAEFDAIVAAIAEAIDAVPGFAARVDESVTRVLRLKASFGLVDGLDPAWFPLCG